MIAMKPDTISDRTCPESETLNEVLDFDNKNILELGCGKAQITRQIATTGFDRKIVATEVDTIQHEKNLEISDLPNVDFILAGAQDLPFDDNSFDIILMFKSLHHVPQELMQKALSEVSRVLKPKGKAYISEPVFAGDFNEILRLFHDEEIVRKAAFEAIVESINKKELSLIKQIFFNTPRVFKDFEEFEQNVINVTHTEHQISDELMQKIKSKFKNHQTEKGAFFTSPIRVDLLTK
ncbi:MAG: class I SAM-dependent methyltransferase [Gammaproteobacteria bacterium]|jgi:ubiquinone/menaquinone biosynthesis C-methylase UbiE|nr:class I SAM-dependent methyltransferase [Xanthomonadales bacterium]MCB1603064.1 class I SAM-dependent methyltransferase [Xanthomonadales bacterium]